LKCIVTSYHYVQYDEHFIINSQPIEKPYCLSFLKDSNLINNKNKKMIATYESQSNINIINFIKSDLHSFRMNWPFENNSENITILYNAEGYLDDDFEPKQTKKFFLGKTVKFYDHEYDKIIIGVLKKNITCKTYDQFFIQDGKNKYHLNSFLSDRYRKDMSITRKKEEDGYWCFTNESGKKIVKEYNEIKLKYT